VGTPLFLSFLKKREAPSNFSKKSAWGSFFVAYGTQIDESNHCANFCI
jgi:hypothetical protein